MLDYVFLKFMQYDVDICEVLIYNYVLSEVWN